MANGPQTSVENFSESIEEEFKITELKEKFNIDVSQKDLQQYKNAAFTMKEVHKIKEGITSVSKLAKTKLDILKTTYENSEAIKKSQEYLKKTLKADKEEASRSAESAEKLFDNSMEKLSSTNAGKKTKEIFTKAKKEVKGLGFVALVEKWKKSDNFILKMLGNLFGFFTGLFGFGNKVENLKNKTKEKLSTENIEKTKKEISETLIKSFPGEKENIEKFINDPKKINEKQLSVIYEKIKSGKKITIKDLINTLGKESLTDILPTKKQLKEKIEKMKNKIFIGLKHDLETKLLNKTLNKKQEEALHNTISEIGINESTISDLENEYKEDDRISMTNIIPLVSSIGIESGKFLTKLIYRGVIPTSYIISDFADNSYETVKLSIAPLGIFENIKINTLESLSGEMTNEQKAILIMLLYKKGGLIFKTLGYMSESLSRIGVDSLTNTTTKSIDILKASFNNNYEKQISNLEKISTSLGGPKTFNGEIILKTAKENLDKVIDNYKYIKIVNQPGIDNITIIKKLKNAGFTSQYLNENSSIDNIKNELEQSFKSNFKKGWTHANGQNIKNTFIGFGGGSDLHDFNQKLDRIVDSQRSILTGTKFGKILGKGLEMSNLPDISRLGDRLVFNFKSIKEVKIFTEFFKRSPELIGGIMGKLPIISVAGIATMEKGNLIENLGKELTYLIPFVGPITMIGEGSLSGIKSGEYNIENMSTMGAGFVLIGIDSIFTFKELVSGYAEGGISGAAKGVGGYMIQPIKDIYGIGRGISEFAYVGIKGGPGSIKILAAKAIEKTKSLKGKVKLIAIIAIIGIGGLELAFADDNELKDYFKDNGKLNIDKIKNTELSENEKLEILKIIFKNSQPEKFQNDIEFNIQNNTLNIISSNSNVKGDWVIDNTLLELLKINPDINFKYIKKPA